MKSSLFQAAINGLSQETAGDAFMFPAKSGEDEDSGKAFSLELFRRCRVS
ncbi:hypothetical protein [Metarhizobium album]|nr:hypothetical protein [Rhizobium album]